MGNFDLNDSAALAASFIANAQGGARGEATAKAVLEAFGFAQQLARATGTSVDVTPTPIQTEAAVSARYQASATAIWRFETDQLDSSEGLVEALPPDAAR